MKIKNVTSQVDRFDLSDKVKVLLPGKTYKFNEINPYIEGKIAIGHYEVVEDSEPVEDEPADEVQENKDAKPKTSR